MTETTAAPASPGAPPPAPGQITPEAARAEIAIRKADPAFTKDYIGGQFQAVQKMRHLHAIGYPEAQVTLDAKGRPTTPPAQAARTPQEQARDRVAELKRDPQFSARLAASESAAVLEWNAAQRAAYPDGAVQVARDPQTIEEIREQAASGEHPGDITMEDGFAASYRPAESAAVFEQDQRMQALVANVGIDPRDLQHAESPAQAQENAKQASAWMTTAQMPVDVGMAVARAGNEHAFRWKQMSPEQQAQASTAAKQQLRQLWGENYGDNMALVRDLLDQLTERHPELPAFFNRNGFASSPMLMNLLHQHGRRLERAIARKGKR